ncbi:MAG: hypothetical protein QM817_40365 [Archangium sp.]
MTPVVLLVMLQAAPTVELGPTSDCAAELQEAFRDSEFALTAEGEVELTLVHAPKNELTARRDGAVALRRELGPGTCGEASRAAVVIVGRWLTSLPASTWKGPRKKNVKSQADAGSTLTPTLSLAGEGAQLGDGGTSGVSSDGRKTLDGRATDARSVNANATDGRTTDARGTRLSDGGFSSDGRVAEGRPTDVRGTRLADGGFSADGRTTDARGTRLADGGFTSDGLISDGRATDAKGTRLLSSDGRVAEGRTTDARGTRIADGGFSSDGRTTDPRIADGRAADARGTLLADGGFNSDGRTTDARGTRLADGGFNSDGRATDARGTRLADGGFALSSDAGDTAFLSGVTINSTGSGLDADSGVSLGSKLTLTTPDAGEPEAVIGRIGIAPPSTGPTEPPPPRSTFRVEVTHAEALIGGGIGLPGTPDVVSPLLSVDLALTFNERLRIAALGAFDFGGSTNVLDERGQTRGRLTTFGFVAAPSVTVCFQTAVRLCGGALAGTRIVQGNTSGTFIFGPQNERSSWVGAFTVGPTIQAAFIAARFHLALDASLLVTPAPPSFSVMGLPTTLDWPVAQGLFRLSIGLGSL